jgi:hypothetical protein
VHVAGVIEVLVAALPQSSFASTLSHHWAGLAHVRADDSLALRTSGVASA